MSAIEERVEESRYASARGILLDIGCGASKHPGFVGMDHQALPGVDVVHSWDNFPWPFEDESVLTMIASHVVEHVDPARGHFLNWMNEAWRVLKPRGQLALILPYGGSTGYWQDPTHVNGCNERTWWYFDPGHESGFWAFYRPKPWKIEQNLWHQTGNLEVVLRKRPLVVPCSEPAESPADRDGCPREYGHKGEHYECYQLVPGVDNFPVRVVIADKNDEPVASWGVNQPQALDAIAFTFAQMTDKEGR